MIVPALLDAPPLAVVGVLAQARFDEVVEGLIQLGFVALFFGVPIVRGILAERRKRAGEAPPAPRSSATEPKAEQREGRDLWKELLEGLDPEAKGPVRPEPQDPMGDPRPRPESTIRRPSSKLPAAPPVVKPARPAAVESARQTAVESARTTAVESARTTAVESARQTAVPKGTPAPPGLGRPITTELSDDLPSEIAPLPTESELERSGGDERVQRRALADTKGFSGGTFGGGGLAGRAIGTTGAFGSHSAPLGGALSQPPQAPVARPVVARTDWRRAVVLAEVLGPPVALRDPEGGALGPPGLR